MGDDFSIDFEWERDSAPEDLIETNQKFVEVLHEELEEAMDDITMRIERDARKNAPVGETGNLQGSIESKVEQIGEAAIRGYVGSNTEYAAYQEFGTIYHEAQPYLRPALDANRDYAVRRYKQAFDNAERAVS